MIRPDIIGGVPVAWIGGEGASAERVFIYLHGGGYQIGSPRSHADLVARISAASGVTGLVIDYRLAPEHRFPAPIDDVLAVRSEEHTSELQSLMRISYAVFCLKKKQ